jgi:SAM-dependent methyltransferase
LHVLHTIPELIYKMEQNPNIAVCGGVYGLKRKPVEPLIFMGNGNGPYWDWKAGEFFECSGLGMGCTLLRVEALQDLKRPYFKTVSDYSKMLDLGIPAMESWTEDLWFCQRIADTKKWKIYCDSSLLCTHYDLNTGEGFRIPEDSKPFQHLHVNKGEKKVLDIGSGMRIEGKYNPSENGYKYKVVSCDYDYVKADPDYRCDLSKLPFGNEEFDIVFSGVLESFPFFQVENVLKEWKRVLKPNGELRLVVDNAKLFMLKAINDETSLDSLYYYSGRYARKNGFTEVTIKANLEQAGFSAEKIELVPSDNVHIGIRAIK